MDFTSSRGGDVTAGAGIVVELTSSRGDGTAGASMVVDVTSSRGDDMARLGIIIVNCAARILAHTQNRQDQLPANSVTEAWPPHVP